MVDDAGKSPERRALVLAPFDDALAFILAEEGGRVDNPKDPGGRTDHGVTQRTFDAWQRAHGQPTRDVWTIAAAEVAAIYRNGYFDPVRFEALPVGVGLCVVDEAVNSGVHAALVELQHAVGVTADGVLGAVTLAAVAKADPADLIGRLCDGRLGFMRRLKAWVTFGRGWSSRVAAVRARALKMAADHSKAVSSAVASGPVQGNSPATGPAAPVAPSAPTVATGGPVSPCARPGCPLARAA